MKGDFIDLSKRDALTGALNRREMEIQFADLLEVSQDNLYMIILDVDNFKQINDILGHGFGDVVLTNIVTRIRETIGEKDLVGRFGGDEFMIVVRTTDIMPFVKKLHLNLSFSANCDNGECFVNTSIGVVECFKYASTYRQFLAQADYAMYHCKENGKSTYCVYDDKLNELRNNEIKVVKSFKKDNYLLGQDMYLRPVHHNFAKEIDEYVLFYSSNLFPIEDAKSKIIDILDKRNLLHTVAMARTRKAFEICKYFEENNMNKKILTCVSEKKEMYNYYIGFLSGLLDEFDVDPSNIKLAFRVPSEDKFRSEFFEFLKKVKNLGFYVGVFTLFEYDIPCRYFLNGDIDFVILSKEIIRLFKAGGKWKVFVTHLSEILKYMNKSCYLNDVEKDEEEYFTDLNLDLFNVLGKIEKANDYTKK